jgi:hypothetical protein
MNVVAYFQETAKYVRALLCVAALLIVNLAVAQTALPPLSWIPPDDNFDWLQINSGEWLKGRIKAMQSRELEFDSEEFGDQLFEWKKVRQLRSGLGRRIEIMLINDERLTGRIAVTPDEIVIFDDEVNFERQVIPRELLQSLTRRGANKRQSWSGDVSLGLTLRGGNSEQVDYTGRAHLQRRTPSTRWVVDYIGNKSTAAGVQTANNHRLNTELDIWQSQHFYWVGPLLEYLRDPFQNIESRMTAGLGVGYDVVDRPHMEWTVSTGPAYQRTRFVSAQLNEPTSKSAAAWSVKSHFEWDINDPIELIFDYRGQYTSREVGETTHHAVGTVKMELTDYLNIDLSVVWDRISNPKIGSDGIQPKADDYRAIIGLELNF